MRIFIENHDRTIFYSRRFRDLGSYWNIEDENYFEFIKYLEDKYKVELDFWGEGNEVGYIIETKDEKLIEEVFNEFYEYIKNNLKEEKCH